MISENGQQARMLLPWSRVKRYPRKDEMMSYIVFSFMLFVFYTEFFFFSTHIVGKLKFLPHIKNLSVTVEICSFLIIWLLALFMCALIKMKIVSKKTISLFAD